MLLDEIIMVKTNGGESLLHCGARQPISRANGDNLGASGIRARGEVLDVERKVFARHGFGKEAVPGAERKVIVEVTPIGINRGRG